jgi:glycosyltransferase involved in cell wall biosynthesis
VKALFLTQSGPMGASARYRVYQYIPYLEARGVVCTVMPAVEDSLAQRYMSHERGAKLAYYARIAARRSLDLLTARQYDLIFLQRDFLVHAFPLIELAMARLNPRLVLDLDDATFLLPSAKRPGLLLRMLYDPRKIERIVRRCAHFIAGNAVLASYASAFTREVTIIPTSIDVDACTIHQPRPTDGAPAVIGWIGSPGTLLYVHDVLPALCRLHQRGLKFVLRIVGAELNADLPFEVESRPWSLDTEADEVAAFDIGIMPLADDAWSRAKSGTKLLQYLAAEVAAVASPVGVNGEILHNEEFGLAATSLEDWEHKLETLLVDPSLRARLGKRGRVRVSDDYSTAKSAPKLLGVLTKVALAG